MGTRGKKSVIGLAVQAVPTLRQRMPVPAELTPEQGETWRAVIGSRPVDWFDAGSAPLLIAYCRSISTQKALAAAIDALDGATLATAEGSQTFRRLLALQDAQVKLAIRLAASMRLSQHARRSIDAAATAARDGHSASKLWEHNEA